MTLPTRTNFNKDAYNEERRPREFNINSRYWKQRKPGKKQLVIFLRNLFEWMTEQNQKRFYCPFYIILFIFLSFYIKILLALAKTLFNHQSAEIQIKKRGLSLDKPIALSMVNVLASYRK